MFSAGRNEMGPEVTPERVLALSRLVAMQPDMTVTEIQDYLSLKADGEGKNHINKVLKTAKEELHLIKSENGKYVLNVPATVLETVSAFRRYVADVVYRNEDSAFFKANADFIAQNEKILSLHKLDEYAAELNGGLLLQENDIKGWRFWMRFLGQAYQYEMTLIPNMAIRLRDVMQCIDCENKPLACNEFVQWMRQNLPEVRTSIKRSECLPLSLSNGLRSLRDAGYIDLGDIGDAEHVELYPLQNIQERFSHVIIKEALYYELG